jgi:hypothetical protein
MKPLMHLVIVLLAATGVSLSYASQSSAQQPIPPAKPYPGDHGRRYRVLESQCL